MHLQMDLEQAQRPSSRLERVWQRLPLLLGVVIALVIGFGPLTAQQYLAAPPTRLRVRMTTEELVVVLEDGDARVVLLDVRDRELAREWQGEVLPALDSDVDVLIARADDRAARGLLTWLEGNTPRELLILGLPGADAIWHALEQHATQHGVTLRYISEQATLPLPTLQVTVLGSGPDTPDLAGVAIFHAQMGATVMVDLGAGAAQIARLDRTLTISRSGSHPGDVVVLPPVLDLQPSADARPQTLVTLDADETTTITFDTADRRLRVSHGRVSTDDAGAPATPRGDGTPTNAP